MIMDQNEQVKCKNKALYLNNSKKVLFIFLHAINKINVNVLEHQKWKFCDHFISRAMVTATDELVVHFYPLKIFICIEK